MQAQTSGTGLVDSLVDGVHIGDNLVLQGGADAPLGLLVDRFVAATRDRVPLVLVTVDAPPAQPVPDGVEVLDWSPVVTGAASELPGSLPADADFTQAMAALEAVDERVGVGAAFVIDSLSGVQQAWGREAALELFLTTCPRLYRRRSLAVWPVRTDHHRPAFLRRLAEITQVVVEFPDDTDGQRLVVRKADGRDEAVIGRSVGTTVVDGDLVATGAPSTTRERLGTAIRDQRLARGLSQAEVARRVGITPSALSQVERGVRGPGGDTLVRLWEVLGVPFGPRQDAPAGYRIARRSGRERRTLQEGLSAEQLLDDPATGEVWHLEFAPGSAGAHGPFTAKRPESVAVVRGVLDLTLDGRVETLHEGDALVTAKASVTGWANPSAGVTEAIWTVHNT